MTKANVEIEWGNIELPGLSDDELFNTNWNLKKLDSEKEKARLKSIELCNDPNWIEKQKEGQQKRKSIGWTNKLIGNQNSKNSSRMSGKKHSEKTIEKIKQSMTGRDHSSITGIPKPKVICPHCGKEGGRPQMIQYHFEKCKHKP